MKKLSIIASASALLFAAAVYAAPGDRMAKTDSDGNGLVSKTEAMAAADARFARMDANGDGTINPADRAAKLKERFAEMDADKNGAINEAEFVAGHERKERGGMAMRQGGERGKYGRGGGGMKMLAMADANKDQAISAQEFRTAYAANFDKADANKDGSISKEERRSMRQMMGGKRNKGAAMQDAE